ncbi:HAD family hydrolase [Bifidobacterium saguinibicoloris]|uniref:HAD family hydrolase n=1 Tax=Bifidobacterium saguinibicoloris TaxID=2834433 RepID=UPI001C594EC8|nr:HAD family hydrolase [Bifidobacterium saguinibicoloris]MBW3080810.1 HAD family hydrolase [Bifidobacterium saguinibicoloris]
MTAPSRLIVADLDGTLLHGAPTFEGRYITERSVHAVERLHDAGYRFAIATARPVSTGYVYAEKLPVDAYIYLNGALIDFAPARSDYGMLTSGVMPTDGHLMKIGFPSSRACEVCRMFLDEIPGLKVGIVMDDVRYTNFDVSVYWKTQTWRLTDFTDVPKGVADKLIVFPEPGEQWERLERLVPPDFDVAISEGVMWMLMNPLANKRHALETLCDHMGVPIEKTVSFGDDLIDIDMMTASGRGVAVANANPKVLAIADEVCPANDEDGVAQWIETHLLG